MTVRGDKFCRLVLGLRPGTPPASMQVAARLAATLQLELLALVVAESSLRNLAGIPFAREITLTGRWRPIEIEQISRDIAFGAEELERMFAAAVQGLSIRTEFQIRRCSFRDWVEEFSRAEDIMVISEPETPADRAAAQFVWFFEAVYLSSAAMLLVPPAVARSSGPVLAIATMADDPSIAAAALIANAANERLIIVNAGLTSESETFGQHFGILDKSVEHIAMPIQQLRTALTFGSAWPNVRERVLVMTRGTIPKSAVLAVASQRRVPVLIV